MQPQISVIIPVFNQHKYLAETINSVLAQTFRNFELIVVDDGSTDNSAQIIRECAALDNRIVPLMQANAGKPEAIAAGAVVARGEWLAFLDHDDLMLPQRLERQLAFHQENQEIDASSCHCHYIDERGQIIGAQCYPFIKTVEECRSVVANNQIILCAFTGLFISRRVFRESGGLLTRYWPVDDKEFVNRLIEKNYIVVIQQEILMKYRIHNSSTTIANTWHSYVDMNEYVSHCIMSRRQGLAEIDFEEFMRRKNSLPWLTKLNGRRHFHAQILQRDAGFALHSGKYLRFVGKFMLASLLAPNYVLGALSNRLKLRLPGKPAAS